MYLQYEKASVKDAWIDKYSTKLATLEEFIGFSDKNVV